MPGYLLDTNVLSEIRKGPGRTRPEVQQWWLGMQNQELFLSVMTLGEIRKGVDRLAARDATQALVLEHWLTDLKDNFRQRWIEITPAIAECWGRLQALRPLPAVDALLAASALTHQLTLVTRNEADFAGLGVHVLNPFQDPD
jgi:predicted nucleic acid-binding protein